MIRNMKNDMEKAIKSLRQQEEDWIWVDGYKGTDKDMRCRDYQFELGKQYDIDNDEKISVCENGFHMCLKLEDVFNYYGPTNKHRYFKVKALVRKKDFDAYGKSHNIFTFDTNDKLVSKSIIFESEVETDELYQAIRKYRKLFREAPDKYIKLLLDYSEELASEQYITDTLVNDGYSRPFANYIAVCNSSRFEVAHALSSLEGLSMDTKVLAIMKD